MPGPWLQDLNAQEMVLVPNAQYHGARPNLAELRFQFLLTNNTARDALAAGEADGAVLRATDLAALRAAPDLAIHQRADYDRTTMLWLNTAAAPFDDKAVRLAAALALDRARLAADADAAAEPAVGPLPPASWAYAADTAFPTYAPDRAGRCSTGRAGGSGRMASARGRGAPRARRWP